MQFFPLRHVGLALCLMACTTCATALSGPTPTLAEQSRPDWNFFDSADALRAASCPKGVSSEAPGELSIVASPVALGSAKAVARALPKGVSFKGGWHLTSDNPNLGGLSGLDSREDGGLLAISDAGAVIGIPLGETSPGADGKISYLRNSYGEMFSEKRNADSEGLVYQDGLALISFERNHRVEAFDLVGCGGAARGVLVSKLPDQRGDDAIKPNRGPEALAMTPAGQLRFSYETVAGGAPQGIVSAYGDSKFAPVNAATPFGYALVGQDIVARSGKAPVTVTLFRSYDPLRGNRNVIRWNEDDREIVLRPPLTLDNFEGISAAINDDDTLSIWIVSDDNFSEKQRTLLFAFDVKL